MRRAIVIAAVLMFALAGSAFAVMPAMNWVTYVENFEGQTVGTNAYQMTGWAGDGPDQFSVQLDGTNKVVKKTAAGGTVWKYAYTTSGGVPTTTLGVNDAALQIFHIQMKKGTASGTDMNSWVGMIDMNGNNVGGWRINGTAWQPRIYGGSHSINYSGTQTNWTDTNWHSFDMVFRMSDAYTEWYVDGVLKNSYTNLGLENHWSTTVRFDGKNAQADTFLFDDIKVGRNDFQPPVPEPSSLLALGTFGIGAFGLMRRRRA